MKIIIVQGAFLPVPALLGGAVEKMWFSLGKEFAKMGHEVTHISKKFETLSETETIDGVNYLRVKGFKTPKSGIILKFFDLIYTMRVKKVIPQDFDIIITSTFWAPLILSKKAIKSAVVDVQRMPKGQMKFYKKVLCLRANSNSVVEAIKEELPLVYQNKISMIPNPLPFDAAEKVDFNQKEPIILFTGRIHPEKGLNMLINAFKKSSSKYRLRIIGPWEISMGGGGADYINSLKVLAGNAPIEFLEPIFDIEKLNEHYKKATIFIYPSLAEKGETFGISPLEAMSWGCVPIVSDLLCFKDFIKNGENGLVFNHRSHNAIDELSKLILSLEDNQAYLTTLADKVTKVRKTHSASNIAHQFIKEFKHLLDEKKNG
ncbi:glycosyltransferase involved in cell wall biosynthesis [Mucilaginibacter frigoritolerans]|uniref:Glycosyltransferase involved in cell wall biosynthesis n=1 Tax=Mucilaginibacter frigoritolerans TaxID=652788 RepID=A0A562U5C1_9SPHI|nr:glycosyltransferase family 4 protein [Mucilaginibacter frigoritolerans]TWJ00789.1 glycosyltransferase involved in cell wall biosynthesis [Mucilaginibacter frigoritolerans]